MAHKSKNIFGEISETQRKSDNNVEIYIIEKMFWEKANAILDSK